MRLDLFLRFRRDQMNFSVRLRLLAGAAAITSVIAVTAELTLDEPFDLRHLPVIVIGPVQAPVTDQHRR